MINWNICTGALQGSTIAKFIFFAKDFMLYLCESKLKTHKRNDRLILMGLKCYCLCGCTNVMNVILSFLVSSSYELCNNILTLFAERCYNPAGALSSLSEPCFTVGPTKPLPLAILESLTAHAKFRYYNIFECICIYSVFGIWNVFTFVIKSCCGSQSLDMHC